MRRYYALLLTKGALRLVKALDGDTVLAERPYDWQLGHSYACSLEVIGTTIRAWLNDQLVFTVQDDQQPLSGGGVALVCTEGRMATDAVMVQPGAEASKGDEAGHSRH
jgi:hypothetical protein